jgi:beta-N-acetylhexosaminidase
MMASVAVLMACVAPDAPLEEVADVVTETLVTTSDEAHDGDGLPSLSGDVLEGMSLKDMVAALFVVHHPGSAVDAYTEFYERVPVSGFLLLGSNLAASEASNIEFVASLNALGQVPLLLAIDQEGPPVSRLSTDSLPGHFAAGRGDPAETKDIFYARNGLVRNLGANLNFGLVADVSPGPHSYIHRRTFGTDFSNVSDHVGSAAAGRVPGVAQTLKHFPGHGMTAADTHVTIPRVSMSKSEWQTTHAVPFRTGISQGADAVMLSHVVVVDVDDQPASLSQTWVEVLRNDWGFEGLIVTDDLAMLSASGEAEFADPVLNAIRAIRAGVDLIVHTDFGPVSGDGSRYEAVVMGIVEAVESGEIDFVTVYQAAQRVVAFRLLLSDLSDEGDANDVINYRGEDCTDRC